MHAYKESIPPVISNLLDDNALSTSIRNDPANTLSSLKQAVETINQGLQAHYESDGEVEDIVYGRAELIDRLLIIVFDTLFENIQQSVSLIAVGGYGRGELHPGSDVDLMLLLDEEENAETKEALETFLTTLWDSRLEIGHSVRTLDECVTESTKDITVTTNIMEARLLAGNTELFQQMKIMTGPDRIWDDQSFFQAKLEEQVQRSGKYNDTAYSLEPNIKESRGGLRDIQMIGWVAKRHFGAEEMHELVSKQFLSTEEFNTLIKGQQLLWRIRCSLHYIAGRREDRLLFDYQRQLADEFGFVDSDGGKNNHAIENFMQQYYRTVMELERLNEMLLQHFREAILYTNTKEEPVLINPYFQVQHGYIEVRHDNVFSDHPVALLELFEIIQDHPDIQGVRAETIRLIREHRHLINDEFRASDDAKALFMRIMKHNRGITHELRRMNRYGILAAYIPAFDSIVGRMQYDLFHAYTVDQHTLFVIRNMRRLSVPEFCHELPLASGIFHHLKKPHLLYLAGLFHDIAKGRQGDHAELGADDALEFCINHGLKAEDAELVSWLVRHHLIMSMTAQRKDISDPEIIQEFAATMQTLSNLDYLYLLTISDIRGTNPKQWNSWKDKLLIELYNKTAAVLHKGLEYHTNRLENIQQNKTNALRILELKGMTPDLVHEIWANLIDEYFQQHTPGEIVWHTQNIFNIENPSDPLVMTRIDNQTNSLELMVYTRSKDHIFANIVNSIGQMSLSVASAQVIDCSNDHAFETFKIISSHDSIEELKHASTEIVDYLVTKLAEEDLQLPPETTRTLPSTLRHFNIPTKVRFENNDIASTTRIYIDAVDRPGLLADVARSFSECKIRLLSAKISTAGEKALDYFDVTSMDDNRSLSDTVKQNIKKTLMERL